MRKTTILLLIQFLLAAAWPLAGQPSLQTVRLDIQAGLSDNCVNDVLVDSHRFLWVGTNAGLDFYDGNNMVRVAFQDFGDAVQPVVFSLAEDPAGILWAGASNGLYRLDRDHLEMRHFDVPELEDLSIRQMCCTRAGYLWISIRERNLIRIRVADGETVVLPFVSRAICCSPEGALYAVSGEGLPCVSQDGVSVPEPIDAEADFSSLEVSRISYAGGYLFLSAANEGAYAWDFGEGSLRELPEVSRMRDVARRDGGDYWIAARDGVHVLDSVLTEQRVIRPFHDNSFRCFAEDHQGGMWAGTLFEGLAHITPDRVGFRHWSDAFAGGPFKARDFVETPDGRIWIGTDTRGLLCLDPGNPEGRAVRQFFRGRNVTGLMAEGARLWVGTLDDELPVACIDSGSGETVYYPEAGTSAYAFCRTASGRLWIGGKDGFIVGRDGGNGRFVREIYIPCAQVCSIVSTADGTVWVASIGGQVFRYKDKVFSTYSIPISNILTDIAVDGKGRVFATSEGGGLWEFNPARDCFQSHGEGEARLLKIAREGSGQFLWITGAHGIHILDPDDSRRLPVVSLETLGISSFNYSSNYIASDGTLYAGTSDGFISLSVPKMVRGARTVEAPVISSFHILSSSGKAEGRRFIHPSSLNLGRRARSFEVNVSSLDYSLFPGAVLLWKIDGFSDWTPVEDGRFTVYDIPVGKWQLRIKAMALSGEESAECVMNLRAQPSLLLSPGAFVLYAVLLLLLFLGIILFTQRRAKARAEMEHERELIQSKMAFLTSIAHEIRTPLSLVQIPLEALIRRFATSPDASVQENLDIMRRNSLKLTVLINELLDFRKLTDSTFQIHPEFLDIRTILKDAHRRFHPMFLQEGKTLSISVPETEVFCETDVRCLGRIFDNLLSNALKYSGKRTAVTLGADGTDALVSVESDGKVLPEEVRELIFKPFYRYEENDAAQAEGTGLGLSTSRQFASLLGGSLTMDDDLKVNRFILRIPLTAGEAPEAVLPTVEAKDKTVMVIEDDKDMARVIGSILNDAFNIIYASNGKQALDLIQEGASPTLIVSDIIMPEMDGIAFTKAIKSNLATSHIPLILLSAEVPDTLMQESLEGGADAYLEKPFSPKKLRTTVDNLIENRRRIYEFYVSSLPSSGELPTGRVSTIEQKFLRTIQEFVSTNLHRNITLDDIAAVVYMSPSTLYKKMKEYADISPMEYVMKMRLNKAVELLKDDSVSVQDVAAAVGFNTHSFFSECFKREFGMTPRQWRTRNVAKPKSTK